MVVQHAAAAHVYVRRARLPAGFDAHRPCRPHGHAPRVSGEFGIEDVAARVPLQARRARGAPHRFALPCCACSLSVRASCHSGLQACRDPSRLLRPDALAPQVLQVHQEVDEDGGWPLEVLLPHGRVGEVYLQPGEMVLYEGAWLRHGRPMRFKVRMGGGG